MPKEKTSKYREGKQVALDFKEAIEKILSVPKEEVDRLEKAKAVKKKKKT